MDSGRRADTRRQRLQHVQHRGLYPFRSTGGAVSKTGGRSSFHGLYRDPETRRAGASAVTWAPLSGVRFPGCLGASRDGHLPRRHWESDEFEYSSRNFISPEILNSPFPIFAGRSAFCGRAGFFHREDRNESWDGEAHGGRLWSSPWTGSRAVARARNLILISAFPSAEASRRSESWKAGRRAQGLKLSNWFEIDYAWNRIRAFRRASREPAGESGAFSCIRRRSPPPRNTGAVPAKKKSVSQEEPFETETPEVKAAPEEGIRRRNLGRVAAKSLYFTL